MLIKIMSITSKSEEHNTTYCKVEMQEQITNELIQSGHTVIQVSEESFLDEDTIKVITKPECPKRKAARLQYKYRNHYRGKVNLNDDL